MYARCRLYVYVYVYINSAAAPTLYNFAYVHTIAGDGFRSTAMNGINKYF